MEKNFQPQTNFLIENFILDLASFFKDCEEKQLFLVNLLREKIYRVDKTGNQIPENVPAKKFTKIFSKLSNFRESHSELMKTTERIGFLVEDIHFIPVPSRMEPIILFRKNAHFIPPEGITYKIFLLQPHTEIEVEIDNGALPL